MAKKPWGGAGAWAVDSELAETQLEQEEPQYHHQQASSLFAGDAAFPSLGEAAHAKTKKKKQTVSLATFMAGGTPLISESKGLTLDEKLALPTGPRDRSGEEEPHGGLGGGFRDYGGYRGEGRDRDGGYGSRRSDRDGGFGSRGGFTGDRDGPEEPSRADIADDWGASKKSAPPSRGRYEGGGRYDDREFPSKADDDSHWGSSKKFVPAPPVNGASRRVSKYDFSSVRNGAPLDSSSDSDSWGASKKGISSGGYSAAGQRDRDFWNSKEKDGMDSDSWTRREADRATERPRLVLQPRSQRSDLSPPPPSKEDTENRPPSSELSPPEQTSKPHKVNPFGEAKPREVILEEKGMNWKKLDAELEQKASDRGDGVELALKEEIKALQDALKLAEEASPNEEESEGVAELKEQLLQKEGELEQLRATSSDKSSDFWGGPDRAGNRKDSNVWSRQPSNGRPTSERRGGGRW